MINEVPLISNRDTDYPDFNLRAQSAKNESLIFGI